MPHNNQLTQNIETNWARLEASLAGLNEEQLAQICDENGWSIKDHLAHIAHWEEVLLMMFNGIWQNSPEPTRTHITKTMPP